MGGRIRRTDNPDEPEDITPETETAEEPEGFDPADTPDAEGWGGDDEPDIIRTRKKTSRATLSPANYLPFVLVWTGAYIATDAGPAPDLRTQPLINGVAGVHQLRDGTFELDGLEYNLGQAGHAGLFGLHREYCRKIPGHPGCYSYPWGRVERGAYTPDETMYAKWRASLIERGAIPEPSVYDLRGILSQIDRQLANRAGIPADTIAILDNRRALIVAALERLES